MSGRHQGVTCAACGSAVVKAVSAINRARRDGMGLYCGHKCSGLARRSGKTRLQTKAEKRAYDAAYRLRNLEKRRAQKREYYRNNHDREAERAYREANMARHVAYCQRAEYREKKRAYDAQQRRAEYGPFADAHATLLELERLIRQREPDKYERAKARGYYLRTTTHRRRHESA